MVNRRVTIMVRLHNGMEAVQTRIMVAGVMVRLQ